MSRETDKKYWNDGYSVGGHSGGGSYGNEAIFKLKEINKFINNKEIIKSVLDVGCGDINMASQFMLFFPNAQYLGVDISKAVIQRHLTKELMSRWSFKVIEDSIFEHPSDIVICFDMLFHITDDSDYQNMLKSLKKSWVKYLFIATYNDSESDISIPNYIKKRKFKPNFFSDQWEEIKIPFIPTNKSLYFFKK